MKSLKAACHRAAPARDLSPGASRGVGPRALRAPSRHAGLSAGVGGQAAEDRRRGPAGESPASPRTGGTLSLAGVGQGGEEQ